MLRPSARGTARDSSLDDIGDQDAPAGSEPWCRHFAFQARKTRDEMGTKVKQLRRVVGYLEEYEAWKVLGYPSLGMLLHRECRLEVEEYEAIKAADPDQTIGVVLGPCPGPAPGSMTKAARRSASNVDNVNNKCRWKGSNDPAYLLALLARDHPDIKARLDAGEFRSVRAAARAAGLVRPTAQIYTDDPAAAARAVRRHFEGDRLKALIAALEDQ